MIRRTKFDQINVIPLVDVVLVLLVIVLSSATFLNSKIDVDLPKSSAASSLTREESIEIVITKQSEYYVDSIKMSWEEMEAKLHSASSKQRYLIRGDRDSQLKSFVKLIDLFKRLEIKNVSIVTQQ
jgi:biopolymer transport protein ExbD